MPVKRRVDKSAAFSEYHREMLLHGPEDMLLAGVGYVSGKSGGIFASCTEAEQQAILAEMRTDWERRGAELTAQWRERGLASDAAPSWAEREFGRQR